MTMNIVCLVIDGWQAGFAGPYGNSWIRTPELNRLAAESYLLDNYFADTLELTDIYRSLWTGQHSAVGPNLRSQASLMTRLSSAGYHTLLISDELALKRHSLVVEFQQTHWLQPGANSTAAPGAEDLGDTGTANLFAEAIGQLASAREPYLCWVHSRGLTAPWDAPWEVCEQYLHDEEAEFEIAGKLADIRAAENFEQILDLADPDDLLALRLAYAAQVTLIDTCLAGLLQGLREFEYADRTLLAVFGARGFGLGEHRGLGLRQVSLHEEFMHVPWLLRVPGHPANGSRDNPLAQTMDLMPTLLDACGLPLESAHSADIGQSLLPRFDTTPTTQPQRRSLVFSAGEQTAIRTPGWYLIVENDADMGDSSGRQHSLFAKPDDRWEMNEISDRCPEIVQSLSGVLEDQLVSVRLQADFVAEMDRVLINGFA